MKLTAFKAGDGDSVLVEGSQANILVDGGRLQAFRDHVAPALAALHAASRKLDLVCVSHIDDDHITGIVELYRRRTEWAVHRHKLAVNDPTQPPGFDEPPEIERLWHNGFGETFQAATDATLGQLAFHSQLLSASSALAETEYGQKVGRIAQGARLAIELQLRFAQSPMGIELNGPTGGALLSVADPQPPIPINGITVHLLGPFQSDFERLKQEWDAWVAANGAKVEELKDEFQQRSPGSTSALDFLAFAVEQAGLGNLDDITPPNLASIMFLLEENGQRILMTGDGASQFVEEGLEHVGLLQPGGGLHVRILKVPHHGAEANTSADFARRVTADHYVFCANGRHHNPEVSVVEEYVKARVGPNAGAQGRFKLWFNYHPDDAEISGNANFVTQMVAVRAKLMELAAAHPNAFEFEFVQGSQVEIDLG